MNISVEVSNNIINNALNGAFEGGAIRYWVKHIKSVPPAGQDTLPSDEAPLNFGHKVEVHLEESITKDGPTVFNLDYHAIHRGLTAMVKVAPRHFAALIDERDDGTTHDVFVQMCLFGEIIFA